MRENSNFWKNQDPNGVGRLQVGNCSRQVVVDMLPLVKQHEGELPYALSHVETLKLGFIEGWVEPLEKFVKKGYPTMQEITQRYNAANFIAAYKSKALSDFDPNYNDPSAHRCTFK